MYRFKVLSHMVCGRAFVFFLRPCNAMRVTRDGKPREACLYRLGTASPLGSH